jgi:DNA-binding transcriptional MocR family regulator
MKDVTAKLKNLGVVPWLEPQAGMFLWCQLPDGLDAADVARAALEKNIVMAPGNAFSLSQSATNFMRFNVSQSLDPRVFEVLGDVLAERRSQR